MAIFNHFMPSPTASGLHLITGFATNILETSTT